jgi:hypothetical protein
MHERSIKNNPTDTILYEIDMLRHCAHALPDKKRHAGDSEFHRAEYYLCIEGFLLHFRNLLAFFMSQQDTRNDLGINDPVGWAGTAIEQRKYSDLMKRTREVNARHGTQNFEGGKSSTSYDQISKFLQHCTSYRHERAKEWDIERMFVDLDPILNDFVDRFAKPIVRAAPVLARENNTTATVSTIGGLFSPQNENS